MVEVTRRQPVTHDIEIKTANAMQVFLISACSLCRQLWAPFSGPRDERQASYTSSPNNVPSPALRISLSSVRVLGRASPGDYGRAAANETSSAKRVWIPAPKTFEADTQVPFMLLEWMDILDE